MQNVTIGLFNKASDSAFCCFQEGVVAEEEAEKANKPKRKRKVSIVTSAVRMRNSNEAFILVFRRYL